MSGNHDQEAQRYLKFLKDNGIQVKSSAPVFNAKAARKKMKLRLKRGGSTLFTVYPEQPKQKLTRKDRQRLKKLRKKKFKEKRQKLFHGRRHHLETSKADLKAMPYGEFLESGYWRYVRMLGPQARQIQVPEMQRTKPPASPPPHLRPSRRGTQISQRTADSMRYLSQRRAWPRRPQTKAGAAQVSGSQSNSYRALLAGPGDV